MQGKKRGNKIKKRLKKALKQKKCKWKSGHIIENNITLEI